MAMVRRALVVIDMSVEQMADVSYHACEVIRTCCKLVELDRSHAFRG